jgi:hypothetical protein
MTIYDSLHSLLNQERVLFHCDEWWMKNFCSHIELSYELIYHWTSSQVSQIWATISSSSSVILPLSRECLCWYSLPQELVFGDFLPSNWCPTADCITSRMCLLKHCLAMVYSITIWWQLSFTVNGRFILKILCNIHDSSYIFQLQCSDQHTHQCTCTQMDVRSFCHMPINREIAHHCL